MSPRHVLREKQINTCKLRPPVSALRYGTHLRLPLALQVTDSELGLEYLGVQAELELAAASLTPLSGAQARLPCELSVRQVTNRPRRMTRSDRQRAQLAERIA